MRFSWLVVIVITLLLDTGAMAVTGVAGREIEEGPSAFAAAAVHVASAETRARAGLIDATVSSADTPKFGGLDPKIALKLKHETRRRVSPIVVGGLLAMFVIAIGDKVARRDRRPAPAMIDTDFEARAPAIVATTPARAEFRDPTPPADPLRHFHPDAPPVKTASVERSRPDYIRVDDATEVWTPARVEAERTPADVAAPARRRRTDAPGADYRFHRLNRDGSVKTAERRKFVTDLDAQRFAETLGHGDAVEVWLGERRLTTIPPDFFS